ncbi:hypothetical protein [Candidatus Pelagibacter bacterium nBUS_36]|uniref:hypothetical protein n=1 Tax=Candidatus Pelagibacter bacterium nBUS_36 TaxID=3374194 RepID=UPI003EB994BA
MKSISLIKSIFDFKVDRNKKPFFTSLKIFKFLKKTKYDNDLDEINLKLSKIFNIPKKIISEDLKKSFFSKFNFTNGKFDQNINNKRILFDLISLVFFIFWYKIFSKKMVSKNKADIFFDELDNNDHLKFCEKLHIKFKKKSLFLIKKFSKKKNCNLKIISFKKFCIYNSNTLNGNFLNFLKIIIQIFLISKKNKINLFAVYNLLIFRIFKYDKIFTENKTKYYFSYKFYNTSLIKNFIYKKKGGLKISYFQKNLAELSISFFIKTDILFSLGTGTTKNLKILGSKIQNIIPVGSLMLESEINKLNTKNDKIDILNIGINWSHRNHTSNIDNKIEKYYYDHLKWLKKISNKFPNLKILIKHHTNYKGDKKEMKILKGTNIKVVSNSNDRNTYQYINDSKIITSFGSTMILEAKSLNKNCFFLDPNGKNESYFKFLRNNTKLRITSYDQFESTVNKNLLESNISKLSYKNNNENYCIDSSKVSDKIYNNLISN